MKGETYNMFALILHPRFKSFCLISSYIAVNKISPLLRNMVNNLYILCSLNTIICIFWRNLKVTLLTKKLMKTLA
jgi:hypothetical protein